LGSRVADEVFQKGVATNKPNMKYGLIQRREASSSKAVVDKPLNPHGPVGQVDRKYQAGVKIDVLDFSQDRQIMNMVTHRDRAASGMDVTAVFAKKGSQERFYGLQYHIV